MRTYLRPEMIVQGTRHPGLHKALSVAEELLQRGYPFEPFGLFSAATEAQLCLAHSPQHVNKVLNCQRPNGFGNVNPDIANQAMWTNGAMVDAVQFAINHREMAAVMASGFHHAHYDHCDGYCTFNGLMVAILAARERFSLSGSKPGKVLIIDGDGHYGDGTANIITEKRVLGVHNLSGSKLHGNLWQDHLETALAAESWDLILYQAGADAHEADPYKVGYLTDAQWMDRDLTIFKFVLERRIPTVWNLAGGYNDAKTVELHSRTYRLAGHLHAVYDARNRAAATILKPLDDVGDALPTKGAEG